MQRLWKTVWKRGEMKFIKLALLLFCVSVSAQTKCKDVPEKIPHNAVEPEKDKDQQSYCPRKDYELKWYVIETEVPQITEGGWQYYASPSINGGVSVKTKETLVFKAACVPVE